MHRPHRLRLLALLVVAGLATASSGTAATRSEARGTAASRGALVFTSTRTGIAQTYVYDLQARSLEQLTFPRWGWSSRGADGVWAAPTGRELMLSGEDGVEIVSLDGTRTRAGYSFGDLAAVPWSPDSRSWLGSQACGPLVVTSTDGSRQHEVGPPFARAPAWSPNGRRIAFLHADTCGGEPTALAVVDSAGGAARDLTPDDATTGAPAWSPDGLRIALVRRSTLWLLSASGIGQRRLSATGAAEPVRWSPGGRWLAYRRANRVELVHPDGSGRRAAASSAGAGTAFVWSAKGLLAIADRRGLRVYDPVSREIRRLDSRPAAVPAWAPDASALAYEATRTHALRIAPLHGRSQTVHVFAATSALGSLQWVRRPFAGEPPEAVLLLERKAGRTRELRVKVSELAADGDEVAFLACGNVAGIWNTVTDTVGYALPEWARRPLTPYACFNPAWASTQTSWLALSRFGVAYSRSAGGNTKAWGLFVGAPPTPEPLVPWHTTTGNPPLAGWTRGDADLLVFATRELAYESGTARVLSETLWRVEQPGYAGSCPGFGWSFRWEATAGRCRQLATAAGELLPLDADGGRIVVRRSDGSVAVLDGGAGHVLAATAPAEPPAVDAALSGRDLVVIRRGALDRYDAETGELLSAWPLPDVVTGRQCTWSETVAGVRGPDDCREDVRLRLHDTARGLAAYVLDGRLHLLRLVDGSDTELGAAELARFTASGLVYTTPQQGQWATRLTFVPAAALG